MTQKEFKNLKIGDICEYSKGNNKGRLCEIVYISEDENVCVKSIDGDPFIINKFNNVYRLIDVQSIRCLKIRQRI